MLLSLEWRAGPSHARTYLVDYFAKGLLQFTVNGGQFFCVPVGLVHGDQHLVHFVHSLVHAGLGGGGGESRNGARPVQQCHTCLVVLTSKLHDYVFI